MNGTGDLDSFHHVGADDGAVIGPDLGRFYKIKKEWRPFLFKVERSSGKRIDNSIAN